MSRPEKNRWDDWRRAWTYVCMTFLLTLALEVPGLLYLSRIDPNFSTASPLYGLLASFAMALPSVGVVCTRLLTGEGLREGLWVRPIELRHRFWWYLLGWFGPALMIFGGAAVYFLVYPDHFDSSLGSIALMLQTSGIDDSSVTASGVAAGQLSMALLLAPALNLPFCFGEEWGWRGYLFPKLLSRLSPRKASLVTGVIWGLWHTPMIWAGHNYGVGYPGWPTLGILSMCIFCAAVGVFLSWLTIQAKSCLPAAFAHGSLNGAAAAGILFMHPFVTPDPFIGPFPTGIIGGSLFLAAALLLLALPKPWCVNP